jgi:general L-amino acid transport system substrate-binding protein
MVAAEEFGITQANVEEMKGSANPEIRRVLGVPNADGTAAGLGTGIGIGEDWVVQIVKGVGNYGEIFERNVGAGTPLKIARGLNALWSQGGLQYAPPIR